MGHVLGATCAEPFTVVQDKTQNSARRLTMPESNPTVYPLLGDCNRGVTVYQEAV
jgi:hypothetical protein